MSIKLDSAEIEVSILSFKREFNSHYMSFVFKFGKGSSSWIERNNGWGCSSCINLPSRMTLYALAVRWTVVCFGFQGSLHERIHTCALVQTNQIESLIKSVT